MSAPNIRHPVPVHGRKIPLAIATVFEGRGGRINLFLRLENLSNHIKNNSMGETLEIRNSLKIIPELVNSPYKRLWTSYDPEADVLYINFKKPSHADDSELTCNHQIRKK